MVYSNWNEFIVAEQQKPYYQTLKVELQREYTENICYPVKENIFRAFAETPLDKVKVVILGQDPYHEPGQAMGLSFSVPNGCPLPPSLKNIFKEIGDELNFKDYHKARTNGDLSGWASQGVLLLNSTLSVRKGEANSHAKLGWREFTDNALAVLNQINQPIVFILWGAFAKEKKKLLDNPNHLILESPHPSPFSAQKGFFGNDHFKKCNSFLLDNGQTPINWFE